MQGRKSKKFRGILMSNSFITSNLSVPFFLDEGGGGGGIAHLIVENKCYEKASTSNANNFFHNQ